jgi:hypothetical protein
MKRLKRIHINRPVLAANKKHRQNNPAVTVRMGITREYGHTVIIYDDYGNEVARVVQNEEKPLSCGARVWIETRQPIKVESNA